MRCQPPSNFRSGRSTHTSESPLLSSCATAIDRRPREPAIGAVDELEAHVGEAVLAPLLGEHVGVVLVDHEVHRTQLVGPQRAPELHRAGDGEVEPVDEHHHDEPPAHRRGDRLGHFVHEGVVLALVLLGEPHEEETMIGTKTTMTHAPCVNLKYRDHEGDRPRS